MPMPPAGALSRTCTAQLTLDLTAPHAARRLVLLLLNQWGATDEDVLGAATVIVSELVTHALLHADGSGPAELHLALSAAESRLVLSVVDPSPVVPAQRAADDEDEPGSGLSLVGQIASRWGVEPHPAGTRVFAELPLSTEHCA